MFKINCEKVGEVGEKFKEEAEEIKKIKAGLEGLGEEIQKIWKGGDSYNFNVSFSAHNKEISHVIAFLNNHSDLLIKCAETHNELDEDYGKAMSS